MSRSVRAFITKLLVICITIYFSFAVGYSFFGPRQTQYRQYNVVQQVFSIATQPMMEIFANGMITRWYDWQAVSSQEIAAKNQPPVRFISRQQQVANYTTDYSWNNFRRSFGAVTETVIVQPRRYAGLWTPIFCTEADGATVCKQSTIYATGSIKLLLDGTFSLYAMSDSGEFLVLEVVDIVNRWERADIPLF